MDPKQLAQTVKEPIADLGGRFMRDPATFARGAELKLKPGLEFYLLGRLGPVGAVPADVVAAAAVFINPGAIREMWTSACSTSSPKKGAALFSKVCQEYGKATLPNGKRTKRFNELAAKVIDNAPVVNAPIVAGWRQLPRGRNAAGEAQQLLHMLRELRMARHGVAVQAEGLTPLEAILSGPGGAANAKMFGWPEPYAEPAPVRDRRAAAEARTDALCARDFDCLAADERAEFAKLVDYLAKNAKVK